VDCINLLPIPISSVFDLFEDIEPNRFYSVRLHYSVTAYYYKDTDAVIHRAVSHLALPLGWSHLGYLISKGAYVEFKSYDYYDALSTVLDVL
jgi:hypothetical protein